MAPPVPLSAPRPFLSHHVEDGSTDSEQETPQPVDIPSPAADPIHGVGAGADAGCHRVEHERACCGPSRLTSSSMWRH